MIKRASLEDAEAVGLITSCSWQAGYKGIVPDEYLAKITPDFRAERFRTILSQLPDIEFYRIDASGKPAGVMNVLKSRDEDAEGCGEIGVFYFLPEYWGMGCAAQAMGFALDRLKEKGFSTVVLWALEENLRARRFYEKQGFALDGGRKEIHLGKVLFDVRFRRAL